MKLLPLAMPFVLLLTAAACTAQDPNTDTALGATTSNLSGTACSLPREKILGSVSAARQQALQRGFKWLDDNVPYSQSAEHEGYRTDCSGFVSMCWEAGEPGETTANATCGKLLDGCAQQCSGGAGAGTGGSGADDGSCVVQCVTSGSARCVQFLDGCDQQCAGGADDSAPKG